MSTAVSPLTPNPVYSTLAAPERQAEVAAALRDNGVNALQVETAEQAREKVFELLEGFPAGQAVFDSSSRTLEQIGITADALAANGFTPLRAQLNALDYATQADERRRLSASPDIILGSVHAVTEAGQILVASASGSQLGPYAAGAGAVIWVIGAQKLVTDLAEAFDRIHEYSYPLEDARLREVYGMPSTLAKWLIVERELFPGRVTAIIVNEVLGF